MIIEKVKSLIIKEDEIFYENHIKFVVDYSIELAEIEGGNITDAVLAALLHDIGRIRYGGKSHNLTGSKDAKIILESFNHPEENIKRICNAIVKHDISETIDEGDLLSLILRSADGLSHYKIVPFIFSNKLSKSNGDLNEAIKLTLEKFDFEWDKKILLDSAKAIGEESRSAFNLLFRK